MENRAYALVAGVFTIALGIAVLVAVWWLSGSREDTRELLLVTQRSVSGLNPQAQVRFRGVRCGKVQDIQLDPNDPATILVRVSIRRGIPINAATTAELKPQGITGLTYIELQSGEGEAGPIKPGGAGELPRIALKPSKVDLIGEDVGVTLSSLRALASRLALAVNDENLAKLSNSLKNMESTTGHLAQSSEHLPQVVRSIKDTISPENVERISKLIAHLEKTGAETAPLVKDLRALVTSARGAVEKFDAVTTEAGVEITQHTLPRVDALVEDLTKTSRQISRAVERIESEPQSIIFGPKPLRPGPGEPGFVAPDLEEKTR